MDRKSQVLMLDQKWLSNYFKNLHNEGYLQLHTQRCLEEVGTGGISAPSSGKVPEFWQLL